MCALLRERLAAYVSRRICSRECSAPRRNVNRLLAEPATRHSRLETNQPRKLNGRLPMLHGFAILGIASHRDECIDLGYSAMNTDPSVQSSVDQYVFEAPDREFGHRHVCRARRFHVRTFDTLLPL